MYKINEFSVKEFLLGLVLSCLFGLFFAWLGINLLMGCGEGGCCLYPIDHKSYQDYCK